MNRERALHEAITTTRNYRKADHDQAKAEADELRRTTYRMCQRRAKLDKLEEKLRDSGPDDQFFMILAEEMERNRMKDELEVRIKVERESMKRDEEFAREVMKNMAEELNGL